MRRILLPLFAVALLSVNPIAVHAQQGGADQGSANAPGDDTAAGNQRRDDEARQKRIDKEFEEDQLPIPNLDNAGPCPFVKVLYDASRMVEFSGPQKSASAVTYSGEIDGVNATCHYKVGEPITVQMVTTFAMGKGPQAPGPNKTVSYWIAVTDLDKAILGKQYFTFTANFPKDSDRVLVFEHTDQIVIPRANEKVSGENFEVLVGFDVTPEQAAFNRDGSRFMVNATGQASQTAQAAPIAAAAAAGPVPAR